MPGLRLRMTWKEDPAKRWGAALVVGAVLAVLLILLANWFMEGVLGIQYTIHWYLVAVIALLFAWVFQGGWKSDAEAAGIEPDEAGGEPAGDGPVAGDATEAPGPLASSAPADGMAAGAPAALVADDSEE